jgi:starvation-inducible DNA-binding protein
MPRTTANTLKPAARKAMIQPLNQLLAEALAVYTHAKQAHWNVRGPQFIALHELFDKVAQAVLAMSDELAERAVQLGGDVSGTLRDAAAASVLPAYPAPKKITEAVHIQAVVDALAFLSAATRKGIHAADDVDDAVTADMLTAMTAELDKYLWFVESHLS